MTNQKEKYYYPKRKAIVSLQFIKSKDPNYNTEFKVTCNKGELSRMDCFVFGLHLAGNKLLEENDHEALEGFCRAYLSKRNCLAENYDFWSPLPSNTNKDEES